MEKRVVKTKEEAKQYAIDWQNWVSEQNLSYGEMMVWQTIFEKVANEFDLREEFEENGII